MSEATNLHNTRNERTNELKSLNVLMPVTKMNPPLIRFRRNFNCTIEEKKTPHATNWDISMKFCISKIIHIFIVIRKKK